MHNGWWKTCLKVRKFHVYSLFLLVGQVAMCVCVCWWEKVGDEFLGGWKRLINEVAYLGLGGEAARAMYLLKRSFLDDRDKTLSEICCSKCLIKSRFWQKRGYGHNQFWIQYIKYTILNDCVNVCCTNDIFEICFKIYTRCTYNVVL